MGNRDRRPASIRSLAGRRRRLAWGLGIAAAVLAVFAAAAWLLLPYFVREVALRRIEDRLGVTIDAAEVDAGFGRVDLGGVRIRTRGTGIALAAVAQLSLDLDVWALLRGRVGVERIAMRRPSVSIAVGNEDEWREVVSIIRGIYRSGGALGADPGGPEVTVLDGEGEFVYADHLAVRVEVPSVRARGARDIRFDVRELWIGARGVEAAKAGSAAGRLRIAGGRMRIESAVVSEGVLRWERLDDRPVRDIPVWRVASTIRKLARAAASEPPRIADGPTAAAASPAAVVASAESPEAACEIPIDGAIRIESGAFALRDAMLAGGAVGGSFDGDMVVSDCGRSISATARGSGNPDRGQGAQWRLDAVLDAGSLDGTLRVASDAVRRLGQRLLDGSGIGVAWSDEPVLLRISGRLGEDVVVVTGDLPVHAIRAASADWTIRIEPRRGETTWTIGPVQDGRIGVRGDAAIESVEIDGPDWSCSMNGVAIRLDPGTFVDPAHAAVGLRGRVDAALREPLVVATEPPMRVERPSADFDVRLRRASEGGLGMEGTIHVGGITAHGEGAQRPVTIEGRFEAETRIDPARRVARIRGNVVPRGIEIDYPRFPLIVFGPPGVVMDVDVAPAERGGAWIARGAMAVGGITVDSRRIAREPVGGIAFQATGTLTVDVPAREMTFEQGRIRVGDVETAAAGSFTYRHGTPALRIALAGTGARCQDLLEAIPPALRSDLPGLEFGGTADFHVAFDVDFADLSSTVFDLQADSRCLVVAAPEAVNMARLRGTFRHEVVLPGGMSRTLMVGPGSPAWTPLEAISPYLTAAVIVTEDARFFEHSGVSIADLRHAIVRDLRAGRFVYGGSTIDMQVVKNVFLDREKTFARKLQEVILSWWMNQALDKNQILELYLNVIEFGPGIYGVRDAAMRFFGRCPDDLSPLEAVYLAKVLPNPTARHRMYLDGVVPPAWRARLNRVLWNMWRRGDLDDWEYQAALHDELRFHRPGEPLPDRRYAEAAQDDGDGQAGSQFLDGYVPPSDIGFGPALDPAGD